MDFNGFIKLELFAEMEIYFGSAILFDDENKIQPNIFSQKFLFLVGDCKGWVVGLVVWIMDGTNVGGGGG